MIIPVEILCLWEQHYRKGDYKEICRLLSLRNITLTPRQLVNYIHNAEMPWNIYTVFSEYYLSKEK